MPLRPSTLASLLVSSLAVLAPPAQGCEADAYPIFACEIGGGRKFVELCAPSPLTAEDGYLQYRYGRPARDGQAEQPELVFPPSHDGALKRFVGATYSHRGTYVQTVRFSNGGFDYTVFTRTGHGDHEAGIEVRKSSTGHQTTISCSEMPRFYIHDLKDLIACDTKTPVGRACID